MGNEDLVLKEGPFRKILKFTDPNITQNAALGNGRLGQYLKKRRQRRVNKETKKRREGMWEDRREMTWLEIWKNSPTPPWAMKGVNPCMKTYKEDLTKSMECAKVFFPMCGDVADMAWLAEFGHTIVGIELSKIGVEKFFTDNQIEYDVKPLEKNNGSLYTSKKGNIRIYCGDFFLFDSSLEKDFDGIWDRGAFNMLDDTDLKEKYVDIIKSVMKPDCKIILELVIWEDQIENDAEDIEKLYGSNYEVIDKGLVERYAPEYAAMPIKGFQFFHICGKK